MTPKSNYLTNENIEQIPIENEDIISLIRKLNLIKANGSDGISGQMLRLCHIFRNILHLSRYVETC